MKMISILMILQLSQKESKSLLKKQLTRWKIDFRAIFREMLLMLRVRFLIRLPMLKEKSQMLRKRFPIRLSMLRKRSHMLMARSQMLMTRSQMLKSKLQILMTRLQM